MGKGSIVVEEDLLRHTVLNSIRQYKHQFLYVDHGGFVICCDSPKNWRKSLFQNITKQKEKRRETDSTDWTSLFEFLHQMIEDLREYFPYKVMRVERLRGQMILFVLTQEEMKNPTTIISSDKDFIQLQKYEGVQQWSPLTKSFVKGNPEESLWEKLIKGDVGDGVPNILSSDDTLVTEGKRLLNIQKEDGIVED